LTPTYAHPHPFPTHDAPESPPEAADIMAMTSVRMPVPTASAKGALMSALSAAFPPRRRRSLLRKAPAALAWRCLLGSSSAAAEGRTSAGRQVAAWLGA
jgi:hypothetical protein